MAIITPPRNEPIIIDGRMSRRWIEYFESLSSATNTTTSIASKTADNSSIRAQLKALQQSVGSGNPLTWDETGFTWDSSRHSFDQTEA